MEVEEGYCQQVRVIEGREIRRAGEESAKIGELLLAHV